MDCNGKVHKNFCEQLHDFFPRHSAYIVLLNLNMGYQNYITPCSLPQHDGQYNHVPSDTPGGTPLSLTMNISPPTDIISDFSSINTGYTSETIIYHLKLKVLMFVHKQKCEISAI